ncbi:hypothetical protein Tco_0282035 [Tanacetum coccineum]
MDPVMQCTTLPALSIFQNISASFLTETKTRYLLLSHSELVDIEQVADCSSLRLLEPKCTIESRAKRFVILPEHLSETTVFHNEDGNPARANIKQALGSFKDGVEDGDTQFRPDRIDEGIEWIDVEEPLDLVDTSKESVYESLIKEMPKCSLNYDFKIKKGDPRNLKIPYMIGHKFMANAYIDVDLPMNIMSLAYYNSIRKNGYEYMGRNFIGLGRDMHVFVGNMSYVMDFTILESIEANIDPSLSNVVFGHPFIEIACLAINRKYGLMTFTDGIKEITFKTPYKDPERSELSSDGHDLLSSRVILNKDDYDKGCRKQSDLEDGFYRDTSKLRPEYLTEIDDEGEVT